MLNIIDEPRTEWFLDPKNKHFHVIREVSERDARSLEDADVVVFLKVSRHLHNLFLSKRNRVTEVDTRIFEAQDAFLNATRMYANANNKRLLVVEQDAEIEKNFDKILKLLVSEGYVLQSSSCQNENFF